MKASFFEGYKCWSFNRGMFLKDRESCKRMRGVLLAQYDFERLRKHWQIGPASMGVWSFGSLLPPPSIPLTHGEGHTPLLSSRALSSELGCDILFKDEGRNPSGSFKDRGTAVMFSCLPPEVDTVVLFSSGNAASSVALYAALKGIKAVILMYQGSREKTFMTQAYGAVCLEVDSSEGELLTLAEEAAKKYSWYLATTTGSSNPAVLEGYKTIAYEIASEMDKPVTAVVIPMSSGTLLAGIWKGFNELKWLGKIKELPKLIGVQSEAIAPIYQAFIKGEDQVLRQENPGETVAKGLTLDNPGADGDLALYAIRSTKGAVVQVSDNEILEACRWLALREGILAEPSGAAVVAGLSKACSKGLVESNDRVVCVLTGSGLKDISPVKRILGEIPHIKPDIEELNVYVEEEK